LQASAHQFTLEKEGSTFTRELSIYKQAAEGVARLAVVGENRPTSFHSLSLHQSAN